MLQETIISLVNSFLQNQPSPTFKPTSKSVKKSKKSVKFLDPTLDFNPLSSQQFSTQPSTIDESSQVHVYKSSENITNSGRKLIDIEFAEFGRELLSIVDSMTFIPEKFVKKIRAIYILYMKKIISDKHDKTNWKKFLLLPTVLFTDGKPRGSRKGELTRIIRDLENDSWNQLTVEYFTAKKLPTETNVTILEEKLQAKTDKRIQELAKAGEIGAIMQYICQSRSSAPATNTTFQQLQSKHPSRSPNQLTENQLQSLQSASTTETSRTWLDLTGDRVRRAILKRAKLKKSGPDKLRYDHLRVLIGHGGEDKSDENEFAEALASILTLIIDVEAPLEFYDSVRDNELCAIPKPNGDIRPLGMGVVFRKLCSIIFLTYTNTTDIHNQSFNRTHFDQLQYGMETRGAEDIIHQVRKSFDTNPELDIFCLDADNAFNMISRYLGLLQVQNHFPNIIPFLSQIYLHDSNGWYFGLSNGVKSVLSQEGFHQGDVLGSWLFCMSIQPLLIGLRNIIGDNGVVKFFIDDGNIITDTATMIRALDYLETEGPKYGFIFKRNKGTYLLGKCYSAEEAETKKSMLHESFGIASIVQLHPDNGGDISSYGVTCLGGFIGTSEFMDLKFESKLKELDAEASAIMSVKSKQIQYLLLRWCFTQKINYWQRTTPPQFINQIFVPSFESMKQQILCSIIGYHSTSLVPERIWSLASLCLQDGGISLGDGPLVSLAAYVASFTEAKLIKDSDSDSSFMRQYLNSIQVIKDNIDSDSSASFSVQYLQSTCDKLYKSSETLQHHVTQLLINHLKPQIYSKFTSPQEVAWINSIRNPHSGLWLDMAPKSTHHTMNNSQFETAMTLRLFLPQKSIIPGTHCDCSKSRSITLDQQGIHLCTGCISQGTRINTHNRVRDQIANILGYCGVYSLTEERDIFRTIDPDNGSRPADISAFNLPTIPGKQLLDIRITSSIPPNNPANFTIEQANSTDRAVNRSFKEKERKYKDISSSLDLGFLPLVFEISGRMHPATEQLLQDCLQHASNSRHIPFPVLWKYWISALMITLQRGLSDGIAIRTFSIYGRRFKESFETTGYAMRDSAYMNIGKQIPVRD
jgi:hypothetical protein